MAYQQKEGQGSLFKNDKQSERQPDFRGTIMIKGVLYEVAAWNRTSQNGREYISLQASEPDPERAARRSQEAPRQQYAAPRYAAPVPQQPAAPAPSVEDMPIDSSFGEDLPF